MYQCKGLARSGYYHVKELVADGRLLYTGFANFTNKSRANRERGHKMSGRLSEIICSTCLLIGRQVLRPLGRYSRRGCEEKEEASRRVDAKICEAIALERQRLGFFGEFRSSRGGGVRGVDAQKPACRYIYNVYGTA